MAHDEHLKRKALELRGKGMTLDEVALRLALSRSTIFYWLRDLPLEGKTAKQSEARQRASDANRDNAARKRELAYQQGWDEAPELMKDALFRDFVVLYMAEGYRKNRNAVSICNSNPHIMVLSHKIMLRFSANPLDYGLQFHLDHEPDKLRQFWGDLLGIDGSCIRLTRKSNSGELSGRQWRSEHGVLAIRACDTFFRCKLQAWMDFVTQSWQTMS